MTIELIVGAHAPQQPAASGDTPILTFASAEALLHVLHIEDSCLRRQINRSYPRLAQVLTVASRLLGSADSCMSDTNGRPVHILAGRAVQYLDFPATRLGVATDPGWQLMLLPDG
jgi:hypothetical protein